MTEPLRLLLVEDSPTDAKLVIQEIRRAGHTVEFERVDERAAMLAALEGKSWDLVISDWSMPKFSALGALSTMKETGIDLPFIIVSGTIGEDLAVEAMRAGAHDYVLKDKLARLTPAIERELRECKARAIHWQQAKALRASEAQFARLSECGIIGIVIADVFGNTIDTNEAYLKMLGYTREDMLAGEVNWTKLTPPEWLAADANAVERLKTRGIATPWEKELFRKDGSRLPVLLGIAMLDYPKCIVFLADLTERKEAEAKVHQQEIRFRSLVENSVDGVGLISREGKILYVSPAIERIFGRTSEALVGTIPFDYTHPDDIPGARAQTQAIAAGVEQSATLERRIVRPDGSVRWLESTWTNLLDNPAVGAIVANMRDVTERKTAEAALRVSETRFARLEESGILGVVIGDNGGNILEANDAFLRMIGYSREDLTAGKIRWRDLTAPEWQEATTRGVEELRVSGVAVPYEKEYIRKDGSRIAVLTGLAKLTESRTIGFMVDLTAQKRAEEALKKSEQQLRQAQKMEAVGRLAGGVAHDFNNILSVVLCYCALLTSDLREADPMRDHVLEIEKAGMRAAALTRQLLMFSRQEVAEPRVLNLNEVLTSMDKMLQRILGEDVDLVSLAEPHLGSVRVDPSHVEQVIMNLVVNSRDAMPTGGKLTIETKNVVLTEAHAQEHFGVTPGAYVMLAVSDTGMGMDKATQARIFEPFFTTKEKGKGTGLGLSTVFGIVQQCKGSVWVYSEPGNGTTFKVYIPRVDAAAETVVLAHAPIKLTGTETILLVEDEDQIRTVAREILRKQGYQLIEARNAGEALLHCENYKGMIHLLLTDVVMPQMSGPELAKRLLRERPGIKVLCMSGYTDDALVRHGALEAGIAYLQKPITPEKLATKVRAVLDQV